jgi:hypothetical protein
MTKQFWVDIIRREVSYERYSVWVEAESEDDARDRVEQHYIEGEDNLTTQEENTEQHSKSLGMDSSEVTAIGDVTEVTI